MTENLWWDHLLLLSAPLSYYVETPCVSASCMCASCTLTTVARGSFNMGIGLARRPLADFMLQVAFVCVLLALAKALHFRSRHEAPPDARRRRIIQPGVVRRRHRYSYLLAQDGVTELLGHFVSGLDAGHRRARQWWVTGQWRKRHLLLKC